MPKQPRLRANYLADGQYLLRLVHAIEADVARPVEWRRDTIELVQRLAHRFLETHGKAEKTKETNQAQAQAQGETGQVQAQGKTGQVQAQGETGQVQVQGEIEATQETQEDQTGI